MSESLKHKLDRLVKIYETPNFISKDPISIPHRFTKKEDIEISGFLVSIFAWGNRVSILKSADKLMDMLQNQPYNFIMNATPKEFDILGKFYHRTMNGNDTISICKAIKRIYSNEGGFESMFVEKNLEEPLLARMTRFRNSLIKNMERRSMRHIGNMAGGSAAKRINMFLRWMVRPSDAGVDFGLWKAIKPSELYLPLDVHAARTARELGLLHRKQNDRKAVEEITNVLKSYCIEDPVKYDFALFASNFD